MRTTQVQHALPVLVVLACIPALAHGLEYEPLDVWMQVVDILTQQVDGEYMLIFTTYVTNTDSEPIFVSANSLGWNNGSFAQNVCNAAGDVRIAPGQTERVVGCFPNEYDLNPVLIMITGRSEGSLPAHILPFVPGACDRVESLNMSCQQVQSVSHLGGHSMVQATVYTSTAPPQGPVLEYAYYNPDHLVLVFDRPVYLGNDWERNIVVSSYNDSLFMQTWYGEWDENQILANVMVSRIPFTVLHTPTTYLSVTVGHGTLVDAEGNLNEWAVVPVAMPDVPTISGSTTDMQDETPPAAGEDDLQDASVVTPTEGTNTHDASEMPSAQLVNLRMQMLDMINENRAFAGLNPVILGNNSAAQAHAESMKANCYMSHWGLDGIKPNMRYVLAGGQQNNAENVSGHERCYGSGYVRITPEAELQDHMDGLMLSPGHRDNILDPHHAAVNLGIVYDAHSMWVVQHFEYDYVSFADIPSLVDGVLSFAGAATNGAHIRSDNDLSVSVLYSQYPREYTREEANNTYCYDAGRKVALVRPSPPPGSYYPTDYTVVTSELCPAPSLGGDGTSGTTVVDSVRWYDADIWDTSGQSFNVSVNLNRVLQENGAGVYTVLVWASDDVLIAGYPILYEGDAGS